MIITEMELLLAILLLAGILAIIGIVRYSRDHLSPAERNYVCHVLEDVEREEKRK